MYKYANQLIIFSKTAGDWVWKPPFAGPVVAIKVHGWQLSFERVTSK